MRYGETNFGYCHASYIQTKSGSTHAVLTGSADVPVYRRTDTGYEKKKVLPGGSAVTVLSRDDAWSCILFHGTRKGYVRNEKVRPASVVPVSLNVVRFAQNDARWKKVKIGTNGGTIGSIGCTTTCLAMNESHLTGKTVTPAAMAKKLTYSTGGSLYWPSDYSGQLASDDTLLRVAQVLKSGSPVVFGAKKANGTQHWVVVTGCDGSGISPAAFSINDPATASRKTLAQYLSVYPQLYKIAWK